jgi:hypothetical protein
MTKREWMNKRNTQIFKAQFAAGQSARHRGLSYHQNPHPHDTFTYGAWARGWTSADLTIQARRA